MMHALQNLLTWQLALGIVIGYTGRHWWCLYRARWLDKHRPFDDHHLHRRPLINRFFLSAVLALSVVVFALYKIEATSDRTDKAVADTKSLAEHTQKCENELRAFAVDQHDLSLQNDALAAVERDIDQQYEAANSAWIALISDPPQNIADLHTTEQSYQLWARGVNHDYLEKLTALTAMRAAATRDREAVVAKRANHVVPEPTCEK